MTAGPDYIHGKKADLGFNTGYIYCTVLVRNLLYCSALYIGPLNPAIHGIRVASAIELSVCLYVCMFSFFSNPICYTFSNSTPERPC